jgi:hypothetical protein
MRRSKFYNMRLPERGAREGEANDAADIEDLTYDLGIIDAEMERQRLEDVRLEKDKATKLEMSQHKSAAVLDHPDSSVTDAKLGQRTVLTTRGPLQTLLTAIGNAVKAISGASTWNGAPATTLKDAKTHMDDAVKHITAQEREGWNAAATDRHSHTNKSVLDGITAAMVTAWNTVSSKLPLAGGTLTGFLTLHAAPATDMHAATKKYVDDKMAASGSGDMTKAVYDPGGRELPYIPKQDVDALAWGGDFGASGAPVSIAYAGANRIDSLTLYGENAQGGTTEAPVALTGVDNVFVGDNNLLPKATETRTLNGVTFTPNPDGSVSVSGTATNDTSYPFKEGLDDSLFGQTVCLSGGSIQTQLVINEKKHSGEWVRNVIVNAKIPAVVGVLSKQADDNILYGTIYVPTGTTVNTTIYPMLNLGNTAMPYEPYQGSVTPLPIPRPLHKVGDVRDVCRTRVKSVYDKRIVLDGTENWKMGGAFGDGAPYIFCDLLNDHYQAFPIISSRFPSTNILTSNKNQGIGCWDRSLYLRYDSLFTNVEELKTYLSAHPLTVYYQSTAYDGTNGLDVCLMKYQTGFVELDGTENWVQATGANAGYLEAQVLKNTNESHLAVSSIAPFKYQFAGNCVFVTNNKVTFGSALGSAYTVDTWKAYLAAQKAAGTPVQVAYHLATPEVYATDPVDFDNAAGPLTVLTGGEVEVRMTELVGSRSPELAGKMDKATYDADGDGVVDRAGSVDGGTY